MIDAGSLEGDLLIVDRAIEPLNNHTVIARIYDEQTVKGRKSRRRRSPWNRRIRVPTGWKLAGDGFQNIGSCNVRDQ